MKADLRVFSVRDEAGGVLACDLKGVLAALGEEVRQWSWLVRALEATGPRGEELSGRVQASGQKGMLLSGEDLWYAAQEIDQTIDGEFWGFPMEIGEHDVEFAGIRDFPQSRALLGIAAIDSSYFEVYARDAIIGVALRRVFKDVTEEAPSQYFGDLGYEAG